MAAQNDETYEQELGDIMLSIIRFARIKNINLHRRMMYSLRKIKGRKTAPKGIPTYQQPELSDSQNVRPLESQMQTL